MFLTAAPALHTASDTARMAFAPSWKKVNAGKLVIGDLLEIASEVNA